MWDAQNNVFFSKKVMSGVMCCGIEALGFMPFPTAFLTLSCRVKKELDHFCQETMIISYGLSPGGEGGVAG